MPVSIFTPLTLVALALRNTGRGLLIAQWLAAAEHEADADVLSRVV